MFYSQFILAKKGPLGTIWIAAHLERKLRKNQVADTDIGVSVDSILFPDVPIALRLSSHLLLGVVRIYSRKVNYLFDDCSEALLKIKQAFRSTVVDLPPEESTAPYHSITLPETFDLDDFELPDSDISHGNYVDHHVSSREQITLQDNMEGVIYSTTQFGLDERFGDGDTSGLDLDEELFLNKVAAPEHAGIMLDSDAAEPHASVQPISPFEEHKNDEGIDSDSEAMVATGRVTQLDGLAGNTDFIEYAQAPCTPGLVEEPNISKTQGASLCDDHLELGEEQNLSNIQEALACEDIPQSDNPNMLNFAANENLVSITSNSDIHCGNENALSWSLPKDMNPISISGAQEINQLELVRDSPSTEGTDLLAEPAKSNLPSSEFIDRNFTALGGAKPLEDLQNGVLSNNELGSHCADGDHAECTLESNQSMRPKVADNVENGENREKSCSPTNAVASNIESFGRLNLENPEALSCQYSSDSENLNTRENGKLAAADMHILQPCKHLSQLSNPECDMSVAPRLPSGVRGLCLMETSESKEVSEEVQGELCHATDLMKPMLEENHTAEPASGEDIQAEPSMLNDQPNSVVENDTLLENVDGCENSVYPAPEKMLSVPEGFDDLQDNFLLESAPDQAQTVTADGDDSGINTISGKKRSFADSTPMTVESMGVVQSKRIKESIPDDNDLLSSILVGRKSSVLKMRPTPPPPPMITSMKRPRSASRGYASKRKVLMDDTMVLHGDVIRQQLTSTEDIRRMRKKAPCTRPEIWMIQKEFLEDEIFNESIFTGFCKGLTLLHSHTYDLSEIRVSPNDAHDAFLEAAEGINFVSQKDETNQLGAVKDMEFSLVPSVIKETEAGETNDSIMGRNDVETIRPESACDISVGGAANPSINKNCAPDCSIITPARLDKESGADDYVQIDTPGVSLEQMFYSQFVEIEPPGDISSVKGIDGTKIAEENDDSAAVGETGLRASDGFLLEEADGGALVANGVDLQTACSTRTEDVNPSLDISPETDRASDQVVGTAVQAMEETSQNLGGSVNENVVLSAELDYDGKFSASYGFTEEPSMASSYPGELNVEVENVAPNYGEYPEFQETDLHCTMDAEIGAPDHTATEDHGGFDYTIDVHDTGFLNADDDDIAEEVEDCMPCAEQTSFIENSGWSSRTRAVAKYLQVLFDKESEHGRKVLPMDNLLVGKTRKEASRMFFEALVLKTRDYIHVEQGAPFDNINIKPRVQLMKSDF